MEKAVVHVFKEFINKSDIEGFKAFLAELEEDDDGSTPWDYFFQKVYLHACLKKCMPVVDLMTASSTTFGWAAAANSAGIASCGGCSGCS